MANRTMLSALFVLATLTLSPGAGAAPSKPPTIAAASDLRLALSQLADAFERDTGSRVSPVFGSSGNFARQLRQGAPYEMFLSADEDYVLELARAGRTEGTGELYAIGRLALVAPRGSPLAVDGKLSGLRQALKRGRISRFAIANPAHAPYGERAEEALRHARLWQAVEPKLVLGENVSQALQFAIAGGAQGAIVAWSLSLDPALAGKVRHALIPGAWHRPLRQRMVLMKDAGPVARQFHAYLRQGKARRILARNGFTVPAGSR